VRVSSNGNAGIAAGRRPLAVWLVCLADGLLAAFLVATALLAVDHGYSSTQAVISGVFGLGISVAAHATWFGNRKGRIVLVVLIALLMGLFFLQSLRSFAYYIDLDYGESTYGPSLFNMAAALVWLLLNGAGLFSKRARMFF